MSTGCLGVPGAAPGSEEEAGPDREGSATDGHLAALVRGAWVPRVQGRVLREGPRPHREPSLRMRPQFAGTGHRAGVAAQTVLVREQTLRERPVNYELQTEP